ncbi:unnamed protein product [Acanthoscelides obtectus]|uniref:Uncharacterized protein n=1 Tax=Acanthoscelides obtectus TaxID=200917 RepID=A0A9P0VRS4_ACAOB|nr:unnamed protein product [Acanthoscelides obtectus]CAK1641454.1 hypothetical protein AOBTE_LOCUS12413 [Acanthoscelides obtectus]
MQIAGLEKKDILDSLDFRAEVAEGLCLLRTSENTRKRGRPSRSIERNFEEKKKRSQTKPIPQFDVRTDQIGHFPCEKEQSQRRKKPGFVGLKTFFPASNVRLQHIIYAVETKEWPASKSFSAYATGIGSEFDVPIHELPNEPPKRERDTSTPMSSVGEPEISISVAGGASKKRKRHIAIDVETERAKLHALLNSSHAAASTPPISKVSYSSVGFFFN